MGESQTPFCLFSFQQQFYRKLVDSSGIRTQIVRVEGKRADHLTITTTDKIISLFNLIVSQCQVIVCKWKKLLCNFYVITS